MRIASAFLVVLPLFVSACAKDAQVAAPEAPRERTHPITLLDPGPGPERHALRYDLQPGTAVPMVMTMALGMKMSVGGIQVVDLPTSKVRLQMRFEVLEREGDVFHCRSELADASLIETEHLPAAVRVAYLRAIDGLRGLTVDLRQDVLGDVLWQETTVPGDVQALPIDFDRIAEDIAAPFPVEPVSVGAIWRRVSRTEANGVEMIATHDYRLEALEGSEVTLGYSAVAEIPDQQMEVGNGMTVRVVRGGGGGEGRRVIDLRTGRLGGTSSLRSHVAFVVDAASGGTEGSIDMDVGLGFE